MKTILKTKCKPHKKSFTITITQVHKITACWKMENFTLDSENAIEKQTMNVAMKAEIFAKKKKQKIFATHTNVAQQL